jgi:hypothetical protein
MTQLPPDPDEYDSERARRARAKGLPGAYIPGGGDPNPDATRSAERRYLWLLVAMIAVIVIAGVVLDMVVGLFAS